MGVLALFVMIWLGLMFVVDEIFESIEKICKKHDNKR